MVSLTLVVPAHNEEKRVSSLIKALSSSRFVQENVEMIFVVDGKDRTAEVVRKEMLNSGIAHIIMESGKRLGKGAAVWRGFSSAKTEYVGFMDADGPVSMEELEGMAKRCMERGACVIASRDLGKRKGMRKFFSIAFNMLAKMMFGIKEKDTQCGCKILPKRLLGGTPFLIRGFVFDLELLGRVRKNGGIAEEYQVSGGDVEGGGFSALDVPGMFIDLMRLKFSGG